MPFSPVYQRDKAALGWAEIAFAEDVIINVDLFCSCAAFPFVDGANYYYYRSRNSMTGSAQALAHARTGYQQILELIRTRPWPPSVRAVLQRCIEEDLTAAERGLELGRDGADWRKIVRDGELTSRGRRVASSFPAPMQLKPSSH